jgi:hypothetical protein
MLPRAGCRLRLLCTLMQRDEQAGCWGGPSRQLGHHGSILSRVEALGRILSRRRTLGRRVERGNFSRENLRGVNFPLKFPVQKLSGRTTVTIFTGKATAQSRADTVRRRLESHKLARAGLSRVNPLPRRLEAARDSAKDTQSRANSAGASLSRVDPLRPE